MFVVAVDTAACLATTAAGEAGVPVISRHSAFCLTTDGWTEKKNSFHAVANLGVSSPSPVSTARNTNSGIGGTGR